MGAPAQLVAVADDRYALVQDHRIVGLVGGCTETKRYLGPPQPPIALPDGAEGRDLRPVPGDVLVSPYALPRPDAVVNPAAVGPWRPGETVRPGVLLDLLGFLELVVLHDRVVSVGVDAFEDLRGSDDHRAVFEDAFGVRLDLTYDTGLDQHLFQVLADAGVLVTAWLAPAGSADDPTRWAEVAPALAATCRRRLDRATDGLRALDGTVDDGDVATFRRYWLRDRVGSPLVLQQAAERCGVPYVLGDRERCDLHAVARHRVAAVTHRLVDLPWTPIAALLLERAADLADLPAVALGLRDELAASRVELPAGQDRERDVTDLCRHAERRWPDRPAARRLSLRPPGRQVVLLTRKDFLASTRLDAHVARICGVPVEALRCAPPYDRGSSRPT